MLQGHCFCGDVRFETTDPIYPPTLCHCESCRRASGAHAVGWYTIRPVHLTLSAGTITERQSSPGVFRGYCSRCFSPLTYRQRGRTDEVDIAIAALDEPGACAPVDHIYMADAVQWDRPGDGRPCYPATRPRF